MMVSMTIFLSGMILAKLQRRFPEAQSVIFKESTTQGCLAVGIMLMGYAYLNGALKI